MRLAHENDITFELEPLPNHPRVLVGRMVIEHLGIAYEADIAFGRYPDTAIPTIILCNQMEEASDFKLMFYRHFESNDWAVAEKFAAILDHNKKPILTEDLEIMGFNRQP